MSCAAFFRFCIDFSIFPLLGSFDEVRTAYRVADALDEVGISKTPVGKMRRAFKTVHSVLSAMKALEHEPCAEQETKEEETQNRRTSMRKLVARKTVIVERRSSKVSSSIPEIAATACKAVAAHEGQASKATGNSIGNAGVVSKATIGEDRRSSKNHNLDVPGNAGKGASQRMLRRSSSKALTKPPVDAVVEQSTLPSEEEEPTQVDEPPPRVKSHFNASWIKAPFASMSANERRAYTLLSAFASCTADRFFCIRALFLCCDEGGEAGIVDAASLLRTLSKLHIKHDYTSADMQTFIDIVDPGSVDGCVETIELEKAVSLVKRDQLRRWPWLKEVGLFQTTKTGGNGNLGDEMLRLDEIQCWFNKEKETKTVTAFGVAAFTESLFRIALVGLHGSSVAIQAAAPAGVKCLWLISFLRFQFDQLSASHRKLHLNPLDRNLHLQNRPKPLPSPRTSPRRSQPVATSTNVRQSSPTSEAEVSLTRVLSSPSTRKSVGVAEGSVELPPIGATYDWNLSRLLRKSADVFEKTIGSIESAEDPSGHPNAYQACPSNIHWAL
jgi:hypothetical protein